AALQQLQTLGTLLAQSVTRNAASGAASAALLPLAGNAETWTELFDMQAAIARRMQQLQQGWLAGWADWLHDYSNLGRANTMSEHTEQQYNLAAQAGALLKNQASDLLNLQENVEVGYSYWVSQHLPGGSRPA